MRGLERMPVMLNPEEVSADWPQSTSVIRAKRQVNHLDSMEITMMLEALDGPKAKEFSKFSDEEWIEFLNESVGRRDGKPQRPKKGLN